MMSSSKTFRELRIERGWSVRDVWMRVGGMVSAVELSRIDRNEVAPRASVRYFIDKAFKLVDETVTYPADIRAIDFPIATGDPAVFERILATDSEFAAGWREARTLWDAHPELHRRWMKYVRLQRAGGLNHGREVGFDDLLHWLREQTASSENLAAAKMADQMAGALSSEVDGP